MCVVLKAVSLYSGQINSPFTPSVLHGPGVTIVLHLILCCDINKPAIILLLPGQNEYAQVYGELNMAEKIKKVHDGPGNGYCK